MLQFRLQTLLLVFVVLASSLGTFGNSGGIVAFFFILLVATTVHWPTSCLMRLLTLVSTLGILVYLCLPTTASRSFELRRRERCVWNLDELAAALAAYRTEHGRYPPAVVADASGEPMHSWRVLILPYLGRKDLYYEYDFKQPWNGRKNKKLAAQIPDVFRCPNHSQSGAETSYVAVTGPGTAWNENIAADAGAPSRPEQLILLVEVENAGIGWMEPRDSTPEDNVAKNGVVSNAGLGSAHFGYPSALRPAGHIVCADGSVRLIRDGVWTSIPSAALTVDGGGQVNWEKLGVPVSNQKKFNRSTEEVYVALVIWLLSAGLLLYRAWRSRNTEPLNAAKTSKQIASV